MRPHPAREEQESIARQDRGAYERQHLSVRHLQSISAIQRAARVNHDQAPRHHRRRPPPIPDLRRGTDASAHGRAEALTFVDDALADGPSAPTSLTAWVTIAPDGATTIVSPAAEIGQGTFTTLALVLADELDVDWSKVKVGYPPV